MLISIYVVLVIFSIALLIGYLGQRQQISELKAAHQAELEGIRQSYEQKVALVNTATSDLLEAVRQLHSKSEQTVGQTELLAAKIQKQQENDDSGSWPS